ncbi:[Fe-Fe] hydrogenase large subunit C-terminal domain-containing protein [Acetonema longum]|uniref:[Fe-Fe] hydrogenase large subunit C-terminal domain-containing protein n=1 Tax=Acetonema longum TaxID=2374 RepID=UPI00237960FB|nr:[Fe-Fe] hydrogenase large subunit C-terminal domain-containing protein [Acetonema longum]
MKEALEFDREIQDNQDFVLKSCCPLWIALIRKSYKETIPHVPPSVSPMVACGRSIRNPPGGQNCIHRALSCKKG